MNRLALVSIFTFVIPSLAAEPPVDSIDRAILVQKAMADAKDYLAANNAAKATQVLEEQLTHANVNRAYLELLCKAYHGELTKLQLAKNPDLKRQDEITKRLSILEGTTPKPAIVPAAATETVENKPGMDWLKTAGTLFNQGSKDPTRFREAADLFSKAFNGKTELSPEQLTAWAYCRIRLAAEDLNKPTATVATAQAAEADVKAALALAPSNPGLQKAGQDVLTAARSIMGTTTPEKTTATQNTAETASISVTHQGHAELASAVSKAAEKYRKSISEKWFGPAGGNWSPKCEITLHATAASFAAATNMSDKATGKSDVSLENGTAKSRHIDLRADDANILEVTLPREMAHIILADLFPNKPPPRWAEEAIAIHSSAASEVERFKRAAPRLAADGLLPSAEQILTSNGFPSADRITGFYVASVSIVDFLIEKKGERTFATFLTDGQRYGIETALRRQYGMTPSQLDAAWRRSALTTARGQQP